MSRLENPPLSGIVPASPYPADHGGALPRLDRHPIPARRPGRTPDRRCRRWVWSALAIWFVLLAPWGGPCDRRSRPADPITARMAAFLGPCSESQPSIDGPDTAAGEDETFPDILDDEEDGEGPTIQNIAGHPTRLTPPTSQALSAREDDRGIPSARSARSPLLKC
jgi:hypothetical protein